MPTINFQYKDFSKLVGKELSEDEMTSLFSYGKGEFEGHDKETGEVTVFFGDTNLPYLWSVEGAARLVKGILGKQKGIPPIEIFKKSEHLLNVDKSVSKVRPHIGAFVAKGKKLDEYLLKQIIDLQEKFCTSYGRKRKKVAIGVYNYEKITFPLTYKATNPESIKFTPLEFKKEMTQQEILEEHPAGKEYAWILEGKDKYPILLDAKGQVLSFPPIINSNYSGKLEIGDDNIFFEATGEDSDSVYLAVNIFAQVFYDRGFTIESVEINGEEKVTTPYLFEDSVKISPLQVKQIMGISMSEEEIESLLQKMQYNYSKGIVKIPNYRRDIMHAVDVIEDIAIAYGYENLQPKPLSTYTIGSTFPLISFVDKVREIVVGLGYQEVMSAMLSYKELLYTKMETPEFGTIELKEYMSERYSVLRTWILPILMDVLSKNTNSEYPQKIFEEGLVTVKKGKDIKDYHRIAVLTAHKEAGYTEAKQLIDSIMKSFNIKYKVEETEHSSFIKGRVGRVIVNGKKVAYLGEINPKVLENFDLTVPVSGFELNLTELFEVIKG